VLTVTVFGVSMHEQSVFTIDAAADSSEDHNRLTLVLEVGFDVVEVFLEVVVVLGVEFDFEVVLEEVFVVVVLFAVLFVVVLARAQLSACRKLPCHQRCLFCGGRRFISITSGVPFSWHTFDEC
jgi:hypothetical protein